jgi:hypothetical protein
LKKFTVNDHFENETPVKTLIAQELSKEVLQAYRSGIAKRKREKRKLTSTDRSVAGKGD